MEGDILDTNLGKRILALTRAGFKVSDLISDLVLREKIKSQILSVYKAFLQKNHSELLKEINILDGYLFLGGHLGLIKENHLQALRNGFLVFKSNVVLMMNESPKIIPEKATVSVKKEIAKPETKLNERQEKMMKYFKEHDEIKMSDLTELFPNVSRRTLSSDLGGLVKLGEITRHGSMGTSSFYKRVGK